MYTGSLLNFMVLLLATMSLLLSAKYIYDMGNLYMKTRQMYRTMTQKIRERQDNESLRFPESKRERWLDKLMENEVPWEKLSFTDKLVFFDLSFFLNIFGNLIQVFGAMAALFSDYQETTMKLTVVREILIGFGCMFSWVNMLRFLEYNKNINLMTSALTYSAPALFKFLIGLIPFLMAYSLLGKYFR